MQQFEDVAQVLVDTGWTFEVVLVRVVASALIGLGFWVIRLAVLWLIHHETDDVHLRYKWNKIASYTLSAVAFFLIVRLWFAGIQNLATFLGLASAGIAIALQQPITNLVAFAFIMIRRPFKVGHRIQVGEHAGDVIDMRLFHFTLLEIGNWVNADQSTGRLLHIPNGKIFTHVLANYGQGFEYIWNELQVRITFESNWRKAKDILTEIVNRHAQEFCDDARKMVNDAADHYLIVYSKLTPIVYSSVGPNGVELSIRYLCPPRRRRSTSQAIWEDILDSFAANPDIQFAYDTHRVHTAWAEHPNQQPQYATSPQNGGPHS